MGGGVAMIYSTELFDSMRNFVLALNTGATKPDLWA